MSLLSAFVREVVEPVALSILQWAWTFDPSPHCSCFSRCHFDSMLIRQRAYSFGSTSFLPHWMLLTLLILGAFTVLAIALLIFCYPFRLLHRCFVVIFKLSLLLFRCGGCGYRSYWVLAIFAVLRNPKGLPSNASINLVSEVRIPPAVIRPAILDRATAALAPPTPDQGLSYSSP